MAAFAGVSDTGRARESNEDRYLARDARGVTLLAVADGIGGEPGGEVASAAAVASLALAFDASARDTAAALASAMRAANDDVLRAAREKGVPTAGTTLVAAAVRGADLAVANLGDSRAYLVREGEPRQITTDHSGAFPGSITRFVGDPRGVAPDVFVERLRPGDRVVLCSDGLTLHVSDEEIAAAVNGAPPERAARALVDLANSRGGQDNVTVVVHASDRRALARPLLALIVALLALIAVAGVMASTAFAPSPTPSPSASPSGTPSPSHPPSPTGSAAPSPT